MTDQERRARLFNQCEGALVRSGHCARCGGDGTASTSGTGGSYRPVDCPACRGTGRDPDALLKAVQAIGLLVLEHVRGG